MGGGANAGGGRASRALRLLLLLVLALAAVEYLFGSILDASPLRTYLYTPLYNATQPTLRNALAGTWSRARPPTDPNIQDLQIHNLTAMNQTLKNNVFKPPIVSNVSNTKPMFWNMSLQDVLTSTTSLLLNKLVDGVRNVTPSSNVEDFGKRNETLPLCEVPPDLGPITANMTDMDLDFVDKKYPEVQWGGRYSPPNCTAKHKVAIIVPFRDRKQHLAIFVNHMHPFLMKQQIEYGIFIVEQEGKKEFNRAKLMNVGFVESQKLEPNGWPCFVFHDIDLLPLDTRNVYSCTTQPRHLSASIDILGYKLPYRELFGGVSAMSLEQFTKVNGFSNKYWGWGGEDDDMSYRIAAMKYYIARYKMSIARYSMMKHKRGRVNPKRYQLLSQTKKMFRKDGLISLKYEITQVRQYHLYTHIHANIDVSS